VGEEEEGAAAREQVAAQVKRVIKMRDGLI
jgi:hypothetical protein